MIEMTETRISSSDGNHQLYTRIYTPEGEVKGLFHVVHGMCEHIGRYDGFMRTMAAQGFVCYGFDNLGHGKTATDESEWGYLVDWKFLVQDVQNVTKQMKQQRGDDLPCFLLGHSMGSFIARCAATPSYWDKVIIMGTGGPNPAAKPGLALIRAKMRIEGEHATSPLVENLLFSAYNTHFKAENDGNAWLSTDTAVREAYRKDALCNFHFTLNGFYTLVKLQSLSNSKLWFRSVSDKLPILLVSGAEDPVGNYGKGVTEVYRRLQMNGKPAEMKLYQGYRHEILNDACQFEVIKDILQFVNGEA